MSTDTVAPATPTAPSFSAVRPAAAPKTTVGGLLRGEWIKMRSLRSSWWTLGGGLTAMVGLGAIFAGTASGPAADGASPDPASLSLSGYTLAQLLVAVLGVLMVTGEYASGTVRATFAAVPRRWPVMAAKAAVLAGVVFATTLIAAFAAFFLGQAVYGSGAASIGDPGVLRMVLGTALYLSTVGLLAMAVGWLLRSTAGAVSTVLGLFLVVPGLAQLLPKSWGPDVTRWLPSEAGGSIMSLVTVPPSFAPWTGYAVLVAWVAVLFAGAVAVLRRRDV